jgi:hypothetical protein
MLERFLNLHKMVAVEQKTKQNGNIFLIVLMKSMSTKTIKLTRMHFSYVVSTSFVAIVVTMVVGATTAIARKLCSWLPGCLSLC